jgi:hypothetical protein
MARNRESFSDPASRALCRSALPGKRGQYTPRFVERSIIVVPVLPDGSGPYDFVLDTPAQITIIDPGLASELRLRLQGLAGVTGAGYAPACRSCNEFNQPVGGCI